MDKETVQLLLEQGSQLLASIAQTMSTSAEHVYRILVRQSLAEGIAGLISLPLFVLGLILIWNKIYKFYSSIRKESSYDDFLDKAAVPISVTVLVGVVWFMVVVALETSILKIVNPEYYAIETVLEAVSGQLDSSQ